MSFESMVQTGDTPMPECLIELQQLVIGFLLIYDALGNDYSTQGVVESSALCDWAAKYDITRDDAFELLDKAKDRLIKNPWVQYMASRDFEGEGWVTVFLMRPNGNKDILGQIAATLKLRPFPEKEEGL